MSWAADTIGGRGAAGLCPSVLSGSIQLAGKWHFIAVLSICGCRGASSDCSWLCPLQLLMELEVLIDSPPPVRH